MKLRTLSPRRRLGVAAVPLAMLASAGLVYQASQAAFTATTSTGVNNWTAGSVALTDSSSGLALFNLTGMKGGDTGSKCVKVTYNGDLAADIRLYATSVSGDGLDAYLDLTIAEGTGNAADCSDFSSVTVLQGAGTLKTFTDGSTNFATGLSTWAATGAAPVSKTYKFAWTLQSNNNAMGKQAHAAFTWQAQNT